MTGKGTAKGTEGGGRDGERDGDLWSRTTRWHVFLLPRDMITRIFSFSLSIEKDERMRGGL